MISMQRIELMTEIKRLSDEHTLRLARSQDIIRCFIRTRTETGTYQLLSDLRKDGLVENPIFGAWRLTEKGEEALRNAKKGG